MIAWRASLYQALKRNSILAIFAPASTICLDMRPSQGGIPPHEANEVGTITLPPLFATALGHIDLAAAKAFSNCKPRANDPIMQDATEIILFTALGVAFAIGLVVLALWAQKSVSRVAAYALLALAFLYVGFAFRSENANTWIGIEMTGVAVFGSLAFLSMISSRWFVVLGLLLHPFWAISFHYLGTGSAFTPGPFALANAGFDVFLGLYVAFDIWRAGAKPKADAANSNEGGSTNRNRKAEKGRA